jgi:hypothetical protein
MWPWPNTKRGGRLKNELWRPLAFRSIFFGYFGRKMARKTREVYWR